MKRMGTASDGKYIVLVDPEEAAELQTAASLIKDAMFRLIWDDGVQAPQVNACPSKTLRIRASSKVLTNKHGDGGQTAEAKLCLQCKKPLPKGSKRKTHKGECTKLYAREYARKWYQQKHGKGKPELTAPKASMLPTEIPPATRKARLDAIREAAERLREQEADAKRNGAVV